MIVLASVMPTVVDHRRARTSSGMRSTVMACSSTLCRSWGTSVEVAWRGTGRSSRRDMPGALWNVARCSSRPAARPASSASSRAAVTRLGLTVHVAGAGGQLEQLVVEGDAVLAHEGDRAVVVQRHDRDGARGGGRSSRSNSSPSGAAERATRTDAEHLAVRPARPRRAW